MELATWKTRCIDEHKVKPCSESQSPAGGIPSSHSPPNVSHSPSSNHALATKWSFSASTQKCIFIPRNLKFHTICAWLSFSLLKMLKISRVSKKGTNHLERVLFMWPALVWERAIMKESKNPTRGGIVSHTRSKKYQNPSLEKSDWSRGEWIWIATPWRNERACLGIWSRYQ